MSYIQIEIGGKLRGLKFNQYCWGEFISKVDWERFNQTSFYAAVWGGLEGCRYVKDEPESYTWQDVKGWADDISKADKLKVKTAFENMSEYKETVDVLQKEVLTLKPEGTKKKSKSTKKVVLK